MSGPQLLLVFVGFVAVNVVALALCSIVWRWQIRELDRKGPSFPSPESVQVRFRDRRASGRALASVWTRLSGANRALDVIVTDDELWLTSYALFGFTRLVLSKSGLLHRVPLERIESVERRGSKLRLTFRRDTGDPYPLEIMLRRTDEFLEAIGFPDA